MAAGTNALARFRAASPAKKLLYVLLAAAGAVLGYWLAYLAMSGWRGPGAQFDRAVDRDPNFAAARAMRDRLPEDYARLRAEMVAQAEAGRPMEEIGASGFSWMRQFMAANKPVMARAGTAELAAFRRGQLAATEALATDSAEQCARFSMGAMSAADRPSARALPALQQAAAAQVDAIAVGRRAPVAAAPELLPADAIALVQGMRGQGLSEALVARFTGPAGMASASPAEQCELGRGLLRALDALPAAQADRITAYLIAQS